MHNRFQWCRYSLLHGKIKSAMYVGRLCVCLSVCGSACVSSNFSGTNSIGGHRSVTPLLRYSVTNEVTFLSNDVTDRYFLFRVTDKVTDVTFLVRYSVTFWSVTPLLRYSVTPLLRYSVTPLLRYSVTPLLRYSVTPLLRYSVTPLLRYSITPLLHYSIHSSVLLRLIPIINNVVH